MGSLHLYDELTALLNKHSKENGSDTPDYILSEFLLSVLDAFDRAVRQRSTWYGRHDKPGQAARGEAK